MSAARLNGVTNQHEYNILGSDLDIDRKLMV